MHHRRCSCTQSQQPKCSSLPYATTSQTRSGRDLMAIGVEIDDTPIDPLLLAKLRVKTGCKMPDCCVLASAATRSTAVATFDEQLRRHADGDLS